MYNKIEEQLNEAQFRFSNNLGTREALSNLQVLVQRCRDMQHPVFMSFIDFEEAFDMVKHVKIIRILQQVAIYDRESSRICIGINVQTFD